MSGHRVARRAVSAIWSVSALLTVWADYLEDRYELRADRWPSVTDYEPAVTWTTGTTADIHYVMQDGGQ